VVLLLCGIQFVAILLPAQLQLLFCPFKIFLLDSHILYELHALLIDFLYHALTALPPNLSFNFLQRQLVLLPSLHHL
jgi:hypothetical protein